MSPTFQMCRPGSAAAGGAMPLTDRPSVARKADGIELAIKVTPRAGRNVVGGRSSRDAAGTAWLAVKVTAPPEGGRANDAVLALLAKALGVPASACRFAAGASSRWKRVHVAGRSRCPRRARRGACRSAGRALGSVAKRPAARSGPDLGEHPMKRSIAALLGAAAVAVGLLGQAGPATAQDKCTIALIPGLTTDAFYITMRKGAEMAAKAVGCELLFQGAPEFNPTLQVPVLQAVIARQPDAILIAPTDKQQLIAPLQQAVDAGIPVITVDTFIDDGKYQNGDRAGRLPALLHRHRQRAGRLPRRPGAGQADRRQGQGLRLQRQARHQHHRPARGRLQGRDGATSRASPCSRPSSTTTTPTRRPRRSRRCSPATPTSPACSAPTCSRPSAPPTASRRWASRARSGWWPSTRRRGSSTTSSPA